MIRSSHEIISAPAVSFACEANSAGSSGYIITVSGLGFAVSSTTPTTTLGTSSSCTTASWASTTSVVCMLSPGEGVAHEVRVTVAGVAGTLTGAFSYDGDAPAHISKNAENGSMHIKLTFQRHLQVRLVLVSSGIETHVCLQHFAERLIPHLPPLCRAVCVFRQLIAILAIFVKFRAYSFSADCQLFQHAQRRLHGRLGRHDQRTQPWQPGRHTNIEHPIRPD